MESLQASDNAIQAHLFEKYFGGDNNALTIALNREEMAAVSFRACIKSFLHGIKPLSWKGSNKTSPITWNCFPKDRPEIYIHVAGLRWNAPAENGEGDICGQLYENYDTKGYYKVIQPFAALLRPHLQSLCRTTCCTVAVEKSNSVLIANLEKMGFKTVTWLHTEGLSWCCKYQTSRRCLRLLVMYLNKLLIMNPICI